MKIIFIQPNIGKARATDAMEPLAFAILSGLTPPEVERKFYDERLEEIPLDEEADLLALSVQTFTARRAYQIADAYRKRGVPVVMGGYHPTFLPEEALEHADAVVLGDAEGSWPLVIEDARKKQLQRIYRAKSPSLEGLVFDRSLFRGKKYVPILPVQFSRGCRFSCDFCSISAFYGKTLRQRPIREVVAEIGALRSKNVFFVDDNLFVDEEKTTELLESLIPLNIRWGCQISMDIAGKPALLDLMKRSGCMVVQTGFESLNPDNLGLMRKSANISDLNESGYLGVIEAIHRRGIMIYGTFVLGYDFDTPDSFRTTVRFAERHKFFLANFNPLFAMPGTRLYRRLMEERSLVHERWWLDPDFRYGQAMFTPQGMTHAQLTEGCYAARKRFNRFISVFSRLFCLSNLSHFPLYLLANLVTRRAIYEKQGKGLGK